MSINTDQAKITIILLSYKRPQNIPIILKAIKSQTVKSNIFLWNNGDADVNSPLIDRYEQSDKNVGCMARWKLAKEAVTPYVMSLDDDICFSRNDVLENIIQSLEEQDNPNRIIGLFGACFSLIPIYTIRKEFTCRLHAQQDYSCAKPLAREAEVDIVKGRVMAFRKELLDDLILPEEREDDIFLSATFANKTRKFHRIPVILNDTFYELPELGTGNWIQKGHFASRDRALRTYFSSIGILDNRLTRCILSRIYLALKALQKLIRRFLTQKDIN